MAEILADASNILTLVQTPNSAVKMSGLFYGTLARADRYFDNKLRNEPWRISNVDEKHAALAEATRMIDAFNFIDDKADEGQALQFPRTGQDTVPLDIELACYEIAIKLVDGFDPDVEQDVLAASAQGYGGARQTYNREYTLDHLRAGIPSATA